MTYHRASRYKKHKKRFFRRIIVLSFFAMLGFFIFLFRSCSRPALEERPTPTPDPRYPHSYDWNRLIAEGDMYRYEDDSYQSVMGIDVSFHQQIIDWSKVKDAGISFAFIRVGYRGYQTGELHEDQYFRRNMEEASKHGIELGVYFFSQAINEEEAVEEAQFVLHAIKDYQLIHPVAYDMERVTENDRIKDLNTQERTDIARAFCKTVEEAGYDSLIYGSHSWLRHDLYSWQLQDEFQFWLAEYHTQQKYPDYPFVFIIWQYSHVGKVPGIEKDTDLNIWFRKK